MEKTMVSRNKAEENYYSARTREAELMEILKQ